MFFLYYNQEIQMEKEKQLSSVASQFKQDLKMQQYFTTPTQNKPCQSQVDITKGSTPPRSDQDYQSSENELNLAFIAEDSKLLLSDSQSVVSESISISGISVIRRKSRITSPHLFSKLEEEFSGMEEWSVEHSFPFTKKNLKRPNPSIDQQQSEQDLENRCTKKKMSDKMKIVTISMTKNHEKIPIQGGYLLRSRVKAVASESSSNEDLREMLKDIQSQENGQAFFKSKLRQK